MRGARARDPDYANEAKPVQLIRPLGRVLPFRDWLFVSDSDPGSLSAGLATPAGAWALLEEYAGLPVPSTSLDERRRPRIGRIMRPRGMVRRVGLFAPTAREHTTCGHRGVRFPVGRYTEPSGPPGLMKTEPSPALQRVTDRSLAAARASRGTAARRLSEPPAAAAETRASGQVRKRQSRTTRYGQRSRRKRRAASGTDKCQLAAPAARFLNGPCPPRAHRALAQWPPGRTHLLWDNSDEHQSDGAIPPGAQDHGPCSKTRCRFGAECHSDRGQAYCRCRVSCADQLFAPVCGSDGFTYSSECRLRMTACIRQKRITVAHQGSC
ncbi:hypothetical protein HPB47_005754, partial [Ixodes persulcatus]